ncbi:heat stress transcription factor B-2b-like [Canna indica]|uniref:Heat stress transcription factor B-2b-like n=1 Tax=Canna indica TaxID=4628 RepID=A0AAQ3K3Y7_9LILI|nr:heat stress transcription factor B-2b-like [Canna indica]
MMDHPATPSQEAEGEPPPAPPPPPQEGPRGMPTPFLTKTYQLVDDPSMDDVISWNEDGSTFVVWRPAEFARDVLPKYFKHNNFSSFVRQLNTYGFRKIVPDRWEFANECFRRGEKRLLCDIHRRKMSQTPAPAPSPANHVGSPVNSGDEPVVSTTSSPGGAHPAPVSSGESLDLAEENDRLLRENKRLSRELGQMKSLCNNILQLMTKYVPYRQNGVAVDAGGGSSTPPPLDWGLGRSSSATEEEAEATVATKAEGNSSGSTRLFGVSIGIKRKRGEEGSGGSRSRLDVKQEPSDGGGEE